ncbi:SMC family ATPase [candidate division KSB1 bacterium]|nr:SMC family ATPase [candidate division KSB1 bacterium]
MIIKSLKLQNYRRFEQLDLEFPENLIGIIGRNGAGKSTIIEAIGWALYGNRIVRTDKQDVRSQHVDEKATCVVEIVYAYAGSEFRIERKLKGKHATSEAALWRDGGEDAIAVQDRGVNDFVENLLQLDYRSFITSVFAQQKELAKLSTLQPEQRRQAINRLIGIDRIDRAREHVRRDRNEKQAFVQGKKSALKDSTELASRLQDFKSEYATMSKNRTALQEKVDEGTTVLKSARDEFEAISKLRDQYQRWEAHLATLNSRQQENQKNLQRSQSEIDEIEAAEKKLSELASLLQEFDAIKEKKLKLDKEREKFTAHSSRLREKTIIQDALQREQSNKAETQRRAQDFEQLQKSFDKVTTELITFENKIEAHQELIKKVHAEKLTAESRGKDFRQKLDSIKELGPDGECPVCSQRLGDHYEGVIDDHQRQLVNFRTLYLQFKQEEEAAIARQKNLQRQLGQKRSRREELVKKIKSAQDAQDLVARIQEHITNYQNQISLVDAAIEKIGAIDYDEHVHKDTIAKYEELVGIKQKAAKLEERVSRRKGIEHYIESIEKELEEIKRDTESARTAQAALGFEEEAFARAKQRVADSETAVNQLKDQLASALQAMAVLDRDIKNVQNEIVAQRQLAREIKQSEEEIVYLNALDEYFGHFRLELAGRIRPLIAHRASELLNLTTNSRYAQIDLDQDYNIKIYDGNLPFSIERFSGGEQDLANLCLRVAISQVVAERSGGAPINFIVLDEIFGSQDTERRNLILNALGQLSTQFRQIFVITHIEAIKEMLPVLVNVEMCDAAVSTATLV